MREDKDSGATLSFLDVIACAFGAIVLLVLIIPIGEQGVPSIVPDKANTLGQLLFNVDALEEQISTIDHQIKENQGIVDQISTEIASLDQKNQLLLSKIQSTIEETTEVDGMTEVITQATTTLEQSAEEEEILSVDSEFAGIPVDATHVVFVIDTSSSMGSISRRVSDVFLDILKLYPKLEGIQLMNDQGHYFERSGRWIPDSLATRNRFRTMYRSAQGFLSLSDPATGISVAIRDLYRQDIQMAIFVLGDDASTTNISGFVRDLNRTIKHKGVKEGTLRLHGVAFSNFGIGGMLSGVQSSENFISLMRVLTNKFDGVLVGLEPERPMRVGVKRRRTASIEVVPR